VLAEPRARRTASGARADLLRVLASPSNVHADVIRQFWKRSDGQLMAEVLMDLEEDELLRLQVIALLNGVEP
jgi:hypothetical protein